MVGRRRKDGENGNRGTIVKVGKTTPPALVIKNAYTVLKDQCTGEAKVFTGVGVSEIRAEEAYTFFLDNLIARQKQNILYRAIRSCKRDPKWMTNKLKFIIRLKRNIYKKVKAGQES